MEQSFQPVKFEIDEVLEHLPLDRLNKVDRQLFQNLKLPGVADLFGADKQKVRTAARELLQHFLMAGPG